MTYSSLRRFILMELDGTAMSDVTYRAYDLDKLTGEYCYINALRRLKRTRLEIEDLLIAEGIPTDGLKGRIARWYPWHRLSTGELIRWPLRSRQLQGVGRPSDQPAPSNQALGR